MNKNKSFEKYFIRSANVQAADNAGKKIITGVIPYNSRSENLSGEYGFDYFEEIAPTAFNKTLADRSKVLALYSHDINKVLGSTANGTLKLESRDDGLYATCELPDTSYAADAFELIRSGTVNNLSFGFVPIKTDSEKNNLTIIREAKLIEVSFCVSLPAYPETKSTAEKRELIIGDKKMNIEELQNLLDKTEPLTDEEKAKINELVKVLNEKVNPAPKPVEQNKPVEPNPAAQPDIKQPSTDTERNCSTDPAADKEKQRQEAARSLFNFEMKIAEIL
jgi:HK97 family phage prohead protease